MPLKYASYNHDYATWTYDPSETITIGNFCYITQLTITTEDDLTNIPNLTLPSLYGFVYLQELTIISIPITKITDIGNVRVLRLQDTQITSIHDINTSDLETLIIHNNIFT